MVNGTNERAGKTKERMEAMWQEGKDTSELIYKQEVNRKLKVVMSNRTLTSRRLLKRR